MYGPLFVVKAHPPSSVASSPTNAPNMAMLAADLRVRMLDTARITETSGAISISGTAQGSAVTGSKGNPDGREPEAAPDAAAAIPPAIASRFSESPPFLLSPRQAQRARGLRRRTARPPPGPADEARLPPRCAQHR